MQLVTRVYYIGSTEDLDRRMLEHRRGRVKSTKNLRPLVLALFQSYPKIVEARKVEYKLKQLKSKILLDRMIEDGFISMQP